MTPKRIAVLAAALAAMSPLGVLAQSGNEWQWRASLNGWLPSMKMTTRHDLPGGGNIGAESDPGSYLDNLEFVFMGTIEARRRDWSWMGDVVYFSFGDYESKVTSITGPGGGITIPVNSGTETDLKGMAATLVGGWPLSQTPTSHMDVHFGARYTRLKVKLDWNFAGPAGGLATSGSVESTKDLWDGIVGVRGRTNIDHNWDLRYYLDAGAGSSRFTYQLFGGVGYRFNWGDVSLGYRHLAYEMRDDRPVEDMTFSGPQIAVGFTF